MEEEKAAVKTGMAPQDRGTKSRLSKEDAKRIVTPEYLMRHNYILAIAIDRYQEGIPNLNNCLNDVEELLDVLTTDYYFSKDNVHLLRSRVANSGEEQQRQKEWEAQFNSQQIKEATHKNIIAELRLFAKKMTPKDNLLICFSGHGNYDEVFDEGYWIPCDGQPGDNASHIENGTIRTALNAIDTHHTVLISDSCYSGTLFSNKSSRALKVPEIYEYPSRWGITAGRAEPVSDGALGDNSPFAKVLLGILNEKRELWISDLVNMVIEQVKDKKKEKQTPAGEALSMIKGHQNGQFVFLPRQVTELDHWKIAWEQNTRKAYYNFLARYPDGEFEGVALAALNTFAEDKQPSFSEEIMKTYAFNKKNLSLDFAKEQLKLFCSSAVRKVEMKPLTPATEEAFFYLQELLDEDTSKRYLKSYLHGFVFDKRGKKTAIKPAEKIDVSVKNTYDYLLQHFEDDATKYLEAYAFGKTATVIDEDTKFVIAHLLEQNFDYLETEVEGYFLRGQINRLHSKAQIETHMFLLEHAPKLAKGYLGGSKDYKKTRIKTLGEAEKDTYFALKEISTEETSGMELLYLEYTSLYDRKLSSSSDPEFIDSIFGYFAIIVNDNKVLAHRFLSAFLRQEDRTLFTNQSVEAYLKLKEKDPECPISYLSAFCVERYDYKIKMDSLELEIFHFLERETPEIARDYFKALYYQEVLKHPEELKIFFEFYDTLLPLAPKVAKSLLQYWFDDFTAQDQIIKETVQDYMKLLEKDSSEEAQSVISGKMDEVGKRPRRRKRLIRVNTIKKIIEEERQTNK